MNVTAESYGHAVLLNLRGDLVEDTLAAFQQAVDHQLAAKDVVDVVLDLHEVRFLDSAALECLLDLQDRLVERLGQVRLVCCAPEVRTILAMTRLDATFEIFEQVPEAIGATEATK
jgi:anti-anti-sigma factor